jgi:hypothetical protein
MSAIKYVVPSMDSQSRSVVRSNSWGLGPTHWHVIERYGRRVDCLPLLPTLPFCVLSPALWPISRQAELRTGVRMLEGLGASRRQTSPKTRPYDPV